MDFFEDWLNPVVKYFVYRECWPDWSIGKEKISFCDLTYIHNGEATYFINDQEFHLVKGDVIFIPAGSYRAAVASQSNPMSCYAYNFAVKGQMPKFNPMLHIGEDEEFLRLCAEFNRIWMEKRQGYKLSATGCFLMLLSRLVQLNDQSGTVVIDKRIEKAKDYILHNYNRPIDTQALAQASGLHPVYFGNRFKNITGLTLKQYINKIRISKAADLLATGGFNVSEAAYKCGFSDVFYFSKLFKRNLGVNPSELIK